MHVQESTIEEGSTCAGAQDSDKMEKLATNKGITSKEGFGKQENPLRNDYQEESKKASSGPNPDSSSRVMRSLPQVGSIQLPKLSSLSSSGGSDRGKCGNNSVHAEKTKKSRRLYDGNNGEVPSNEVAAQPMGPEQNRKPQLHEFDKRNVLDIGKGQSDPRATDGIDPLENKGIEDDCGRLRTTPVHHVHGDAPKRDDVEGNELRSSQLHQLPFNQEGGNSRQGPAVPSLRMPGLGQRGRENDHITTAPRVQLPKFSPGVADDTNNPSSKLSAMQGSSPSSEAPVPPSECAPSPPCAEPAQPKVVPSYDDEAPNPLGTEGHDLQGVEDLRSERKSSHPPNEPSDTHKATTAERKAGSPLHSPDSQTQHQQEQPGQSDNAEDGLIGKRIAKTFAGHGRFTGRVTSFSPKTQLYMVVYTDGDSEEFSKQEVQKLLIKTAPRGPGPQRGSGVPLGSGGQYNSVSGRPVDPEARDAHQQEVFDVYILPVLLRQGWQVEQGSRSTDRFFFPPGVTRQNGKVRIDYFDSVKQVVNYISQYPQLAASVFPPEWRRQHIDSNAVYPHPIQGGTPPEHYQPGYRGPPSQYAGIGRADMAHYAQQDPRLANELLEHTPKRAMGVSPPEIHKRARTLSSREEEEYVARMHQQGGYMSQHQMGMLMNHPQMQEYMRARVAEGASSVHLQQIYSAKMRQMQIAASHDEQVRQGCRAPVDTGRKGSNSPAMNTQVGAVAQAKVQGQGTAPTPSGSDGPRDMDPNGQSGQSPRPGCKPISSKEGSPVVAGKSAGGVVMDPRQCGQTGREGWSLGSDPRAGPRAQQYRMTRAEFEMHQRGIEVDPRTGKPMAMIHPGMAEYYAREGQYPLEHDHHAASKSMSAAMEYSNEYQASRAEMNARELYAAMTARGYLPQDAAAYVRRHQGDIEAAANAAVAIKPTIVGGASREGVPPSTASMRERPVAAASSASGVPSAHTGGMATTAGGRCALQEGASPGSHCFSMSDIARSGGYQEGRGGEHPGHDPRYEMERAKYEQVMAARACGYPDEQPRTMQQYAVSAAYIHGSQGASTVFTSAAACTAAGTSGRGDARGRAVSSSAIVTSSRAGGPSPTVRGYAPEGEVGRSFPDPRTAAIYAQQRAAFESSAIRQMQPGYRGHYYDDERQRAYAAQYYAHYGERSSPGGPGGLGVQQLGGLPQYEYSESGRSPPGYEQQGGPYSGYRRRM